MCVVNETRGGAESPKSALDLVGAEGGVERNSAAWGRVEVGRQRGNGAREWALKRARLLSGITAALLRIYARHQRQETAGVVVARKKEE